MHPVHLFDELMIKYGVSTDADIASILSLTPGHVSQLRKSEKELTARQIVSFMQKVGKYTRADAFADSIKPVVEMYKIAKESSAQGKKWEVLLTGEGSVRSNAIRKHLELVQGIYAFFDSQGIAIYVGKTVKRNLWAEMKDAYNRERSNHKIVVVSHPTTGDSFVPAWQKKRAPTIKQAYLYDTASYFSAYEVAPELIPKLEAFATRVFCNTLSNKKMENF